jgi:predicted dehydrogenase
MQHKHTLTTRQLTRRQFITTAGLGAAALATMPAWAAAAPSIRKGALVTGRKLNVACVGCGGKGGGDVNDVAGENLVAFCDVDWERAKGTFQKHVNVPRYRDYRKMLLEMDDRIDAVTVSTPDHMHFPIAMMAIQMGKHLFVQKPLTHSVWEARTITEAARRHGVVTQMGIQGHSKEGIRLVKEWLDADAIGHVREVHLWTNRPIWPQGIDRPADTQPVPETLDWNLWLGVAPERPYHKSYLPFDWRGWWDFGCGALGDIGCHSMDAPFYALDLGSPRRIEVEMEGSTRETGPLKSKLTYYFPARLSKPAVKLFWYDGGRKPPRPPELEEDRDLPGGGGQFYVGDKGTLLANGTYCDSPRVVPETKRREFMKRAPEKTIPRSPGHMKEWIDACKGEGPAPGANFDFSGPLTEMVLLGNLAVRTGKTIDWDPYRMRCTNVPEANAYVRRRYRVF